MGVEAILRWMQMPEATVHENDFAAGAENEIGVSGQVAAVQAIAIAEGCEDQFETGSRSAIMTCFSG